MFKKYAGWIIIITLTSFCLYCICFFIIHADDKMLLFNGAQAIAFITGGLICFCFGWIPVVIVLGIIIENLLAIIFLLFILFIIFSIW